MDAPLIPTNATLDPDKLPRVQKRVYYLLKGGGRYTSIQISLAAGVTDPRGHIKALRDKGYDIRDEWVKSDFWGTRCKVFFLA